MFAEIKSLSAASFVAPYKFIGDAAFEEDYVLASISWIAKKKIPVLLVVEDNNFAITTSKKERRDWSVKQISKAFGIEYNFHKEAFKILESYYKPGEFNEGRQKMVWMPHNAKLILNPTSGAPGFNVDNVFCLPGVPSILKSMLGSLKQNIVGGDPILSHTISLRTVESEIANSLSKVQDQNKDVEIGSYPFFHAGKLGVSIVLRSEQQSKIDDCSAQILNFIKEKKIEIVDR